MLRWKQQNTMHQWSVYDEFGPIFSRFVATRKNRKKNGFTTAPSSSCTTLFFLFTTSTPFTRKFRSAHTQHSALFHTKWNIFFFAFPFLAYLSRVAVHTHTHPRTYMKSVKAAARALLWSQKRKPKRFYVDISDNLPIKRTHRRMVRFFLMINYSVYPASFDYC